ncbi:MULTISPECIES: small ribosomal subunit Rsm22 family protein [Halorussus]|uniref:small ribosomal subunit Rsm22 family protein n=1 Tax=Halorussus TaxID=1070314 RepID=UPI000E214DF1|nr:MULTISPECIES: class I SAM-dependent methyltransferase [Halorussus]NHN59222.1 class I SAM-dependent methyltransferase [Halorussus sp. JP-T4]
MSDDQRRKIRENAKYLREVRPVDPDEISEYVDGQPHPGVVRKTLREEAPSLGLVEREDGTFEPVAEGPLAPAFRGVEAFPTEYSRLLEDLLVERWGPDWHEGESGDRLRETIRRLKEDYFRNNDVEYDETAALGYAVYHLADNYAVAQYALHELAESGLVDHRLRILDVGAGVGGPALGVADYLPDEALVEYDAVEPSAAADVFEQTVSAVGRNVHVDLHRETAEAFEPEGEYDLVLFANVLNELDDPAAVVRRYLDSLADDGAVLAVEPADRETSIGLREVERAIADEAAEAAVFAPTLRLWPGERPTDRGWSFDVKPDLEVPPFQRKLDEAAGATGEFVNVDVQFSYSILRPDGRRKADLTLDAGNVAKMAEMERHVTERIDLVAVKLSHSLAEGDRNPLFKVGDGSESVDHFAVLTNETSLNADLRDADYGDLLSFERVLVLWNDDEEAYNLVVDEDTIVDAVRI